MKKENLIDQLYTAGVVFLIVATLTVGMYGINLYKEGKIIGTSAQNVIVVTGEGKVSVKPDMGNLVLTLRESGKDSKTAQDKVSKKSAEVLKELKGLVDEKDIKTENYNSYPKYVYSANMNPTITGYEVSQNISIKVKDIQKDEQKISKVLDIIAKAGINEVSGPNYEVENPDNYKDQARKEAITKAKAKAEKLADNLGVSLGRITNFSENVYGEMYFAPYAKAGISSVGASSDSKPSLPSGENDVTSNVTITFEIK